MRSCQSQGLSCSWPLQISGESAAEHNSPKLAPSCGVGSVCALRKKKLPMMEPQQPLRVLCADDNVLVLDMLSKTLQSATRRFRGGGTGPLGRLRRKDHRFR